MLKRISSKLESIAARAPKDLARPLTKTPDWLQKPVAEKLLNQMLCQPMAEGEMDFLEGKWLEIRVEDLDYRICFSKGIRGLEVDFDAAADVSICGAFNELLVLASRTEDPDTLFFQRRLRIEGDTEIGLNVKNLLDSLELDVLPMPFRKGLEKSAQLVERFS
ncbi:ubiquinone anaerobic biosynthesis accessory factor UbiT [Pelagibaculum spongiae]|uniref:Ubiquinone biosynthesis accessory factor UbiT n=1 Tax=Pelagibaculum spongiae TaxID=2080658 RepID=A0A2V1H066_9GAMM|nr:SCP2 sterol-binding domain-containing protein [Pelagibaculum spongiae]PVZ69001.1 SCP2 domain-containing protein [Pelagibaculum spongiae]